MRAIMVSVEYTDLLSVTLPWNRHHFQEVYVVTSPADAPEVRKVCEANRAKVVVTDLFYADGAVFNKFRALEHGLDVMGRHGWICQMDADILWPEWVSNKPGEGAIWRYLQPGYLFTPYRRMMTDTSSLLTDGVPDEATWGQYPIHRNVNEFAGYSQIYFASDPVLGKPPWHEIDWAHAGGADSFFQRKWPAERKVRPPFEVLHLGPAGQNWCGRATNYLDGSKPADAGDRVERMMRIWEERRGKATEAERFRGEKLK